MNETKMKNLMTAATVIDIGNHIIKKMAEKYNRMLANGYELVSIHEVLSDLRNCKRLPSNDYRWK